MTGRLGRYGDPLDDDDSTPYTTTRTRDEIHRERIAELRRILAASRQRREDQP